MGWKFVLLFFVACFLAGFGLALFEARVQKRKLRQMADSLRQKEEG